MKQKEYDTTALAFLGDAVYEVYVRQRVMASGQRGADRLHRMAVKYVKAGSQAKAIKTLYDDLPSDEQTLVRRARNKKSSTKAKNADPVTYKWATAFEAFIGHLYTTGQKGRMEEIIDRAMAIVDGEVE